MKAGAIIAAAGRSRRMGSPKALLKHGDQTFLGHLIDTFVGGGVSPVVVVLGAGAEKIAAAVDLSRGTLAVNRDPRTEMIDSIRLGERYLPGDVDAVWVTPVDAPFVSVELIAALRDAWPVDEDGAAAVVPVAGGVQGHPVLLSRQALYHPAADDGLRGLLGRDAGTLQVVEVPWEDARVTADLNTPGDLERHLPDAIPGKLPDEAADSPSDPPESHEQ